MSESKKPTLPTRTDSSNILDDIQRVLEKFDYGDASFQVKRANGKNHQLIVSYFDHVRYPSNHEATSAIIQSLVGLSNQGYDGAYTFTVNYKGGTIREVIYEGLEQTRYGQ